jgi:hypothetical protein
MKSASSIVGQVIFFGCIAILLGVFSVKPQFAHFESDKALIRLSFIHAGERTVECHKRTAKELRELPPNMRKPLDCPRRRVDLIVELVLDGELLFRESLPPSGIAGDGSGQVYEGFVVEPGSHNLVVRLRDSRRDSGFDYEREAQIELSPRENFVVDFRPEDGILLIEGGSHVETD